HSGDVVADRRGGVHRGRLERTDRRGLDRLARRVAVGRRQLGAPPAVRRPRPALGLDGRDDCAVRRGPLTHARMTRQRVLPYANDHVGELVAGPGVRSQAFARELGRSHDVVLAAPHVAGSSVEAVEVPPGAHAALYELARWADVVVTQRLPLTVAL